MTIPELVDKCTEFITVLANLLVFGFAITGYQTTGKRSLLFIGIPCGMWAVLSLGNAVLPRQPSWFWWGAYIIANLLSYGLWVVGSGRLFRDYSQILLGSGQPRTAPSGGPGSPISGQEATGGPPSVS